MECVPLLLHALRGERAFAARQLLLRACKKGVSLE
jgi:hypothetical protein